MKDHFEVNVVPLSIGITQSFYNKIMEFCFPEERMSGSATNSVEPRKSEEEEHHHEEGPLLLLPSDDVEQMRERAKLNKLFTYIKIPAVPICVSFRNDKGNGVQKREGQNSSRSRSKILDVENFVLQVPMLEYHNVTWTWLDFLLAVKSQTKDSLLSQAIKKKLTLSVLARKSSKRVVGSSGIVAIGSGEGSTATAGRSEQEKSRMLLGNLS